MRRTTVAVVGPSGSGKTTLGADLAAQLDVPAIDLDALHHGPGWAPTPTPEFRARVAEAIEAAAEHAGGWVVSGNYLQVADIVHGGADTIVWTDLPRGLTTSRVLRRSIRRAITREELWNGNREEWRNLLSQDAERNVVLWAWRSHPGVRAKYEALAESPLWRGAEVVRLRSRREVATFRRSFGADD